MLQNQRYEFRFSSTDFRVQSNGRFKVNFRADFSPFFDQFLFDLTLFRSSERIVQRINICKQLSIGVNTMTRRKTKFRISSVRFSLYIDLKMNIFLWEKKQRSLEICINKYTKLKAAI